jgi:hypothetical protein
MGTWPAPEREQWTTGTAGSAKRPEWYAPEKSQELIKKIPPGNLTKWDWSGILPLCEPLQALKLLAV